MKRDSDDLDVLLGVPEPAEQPPRKCRSCLGPITSGRYCSDSCEARDTDHFG